MVDESEDMRRSIIIKPRHLRLDSGLGGQPAIPDKDFHNHNNRCLLGLSFFFVKSHTGKPQLAKEWDVLLGHHIQSTTLNDSPQVFAMSLCH